MYSHHLVMPLVADMLLLGSQSINIRFRVITNLFRKTETEESKNIGHGIWNIEVNDISHRKHAITKSFFCSDCGISRAGDANHYIHCDTCGWWVTKNFHRCKLEVLHQNCPICLEDQFTSRDPWIILEWSHTMHKKWFWNLLSHDIKCPLWKQNFWEISQESDITMS